jgi:hypothetical protein
MTIANPDYPVRLEIERPERLSRLLPFVKWLLAIPHFVVLYLLGIIAYIALVFAFFAVLFTGRYPRAVFDYLVGFERWRLRVTAYLLLQTDRYPPFSLADDPGYPVHLEIDYPERVARWRPLLNWLLVIPSLFAAAIIGVFGFLAVIAAFFAILFTGRFPDGLFDTVLVAERWSARTIVYAVWMTEAYPPFVWA